MDIEVDKKELWMRLALRAARRGWGTTNPNPMVGAVVVKNGRLAGIGYHEFAGGPHAEVNALRAAGKLAKNADLYVTMEPCCTYGRTPPCTQAIIDAGIKRVIIGAIDDNPKHAGRGIEILESAGVQVEVGMLEEDCRRLNREFFWWIKTGSPYVILKMAQSLDGKIALANGDSKWISSTASRNIVQKLRRRADLIMVGGETVRQDNPALLVTKTGWSRQPDVCVWTSRSLPEELQIFHNASRRVWSQKPNDKDEWKQFLSRCGASGYSVILLEGGGELAASALRAGVVNRLVWFVAPKIIGGRDARPSVGGCNLMSLQDAIELKDVKLRRSGGDIVIAATPEMKS